MIEFKENRDEIYWRFGYDLYSKETPIDQKWELYPEKIAILKGMGKIFL